MAWKEFFVYGINATLTAGTGVTYQNSSLRIDSDADFEFQKTVYQATSGNVRLKYRDESMGRYLIKGSSDLRSIGGNFAGTPFIWPRPYMILAGTTFTLEAADNSGVANVLRIVFHGAKIRQGLAPWEGNVRVPGKPNEWERRFRAVVPFVYSTESQALTANGTAPLRIEIDNDAHFLVQKVSGQRQGACTLDIIEAAKDRSWSNTPIHFDNLVGNGQFPMIMYANRFIYRGSVVNIQAADLSGLANSLEVNLIGVKLYE